MLYVVTDTDIIFVSQCQLGMNCGFHAVLGERLKMIFSSGILRFAPYRVAWFLARCCANNTSLPVSSFDLFL